jgi:nicotinate-nucleotide adenylyltransferase
MDKRTIALFGGTFDPIHLGHTIVAAKASEDIGAEEIVFIPAKRSVLKDSAPQAAGNHRLAMIALGIADNKRFRVSDNELNKSGPSYTIETVRQFRADYGSETLFYWLIGADAVDDLPHWYRIEELIDECNLCVMFRAGFDAPDFAKFTAILDSARVEKLQQNIIKTPLIDISSTEIRDRLAAGGDVTDMVHPAVIDYIRKHGLYQSKGPESEAD